MIKKFLIAACMLFCVSGAYAQIKVGAKAGVNLATLTNDESAKMKFGFHVGGFAQFAINERIAIQPELLYSAQGADSDGDGSIALGYINLPVLLKVNLVEGLSAEVGPQVGYLLSAKIEAGGVSVDMKDFCKKLDVTAVVGLSYTFSEKFVVGARYGFGLTAVNKDIPELFQGEKSKNSVISLSFGYKF